MLQRYQMSERLLERALKTIPLGSQTFSKSYTQFPKGVSPYFAMRGKGSKLWDVDGNEYIDFINGLASINLGYCDPDVDDAVRAQLSDGVIFSLSHALEHQVAEQIVEMVPCAEKVRFGKNGSDATAGAIRAARAFTGRERVAVCGYHGWQDWYIGSTTRSLGVPQAVRSLTHTFPYNDVPTLEKLMAAHRDEFAAIIIEPMNVAEPASGYFEELKIIARKHGALLIFDETITGFRFSPGGAQQLFGVIPDLATFGKGMANGYPVSALTGRSDVMKVMEEVFFSFTFGGETLSLAAALSTMKKVQSKKVTDVLVAQGQKIKDGLVKLVVKHGLQGVVSISGHATWSFVGFKDTAPYSMWDIKTLYLQEIFSRGILTLGTHNMSFSHSDADIAALLKAYDEVFSVLQSALKAEDLFSRLRCDVLQPLFKVR